MQSTPKIAATLPAAAVSRATHASALPVPVSDPQQFRQQIYTVSAVLDGIDLRAQGVKAAPDNPAGPQHHYLHCNEWSRAQQKQ
jgi:hypothetical protein